MPMTPIIALDSTDYFVIDRLVKSCYEDNKTCKKALFEINKHQKNAAKNKKFSCQTNLLGLEGNLIMAMKNNLKRIEAKSITQTLNEFC